MTLNCLHRFLHCHPLRVKMMEVIRKHPFKQVLSRPLFLAALQNSHTFSLIPPPKKKPLLVWSPVNTAKFEAGGGALVTVLTGFHYISNFDCP